MEVVVDHGFTLGGEEGEDVAAVDGAGVEEVQRPVEAAGADVADGGAALQAGQQLAAAGGGWEVVVAVAAALPGGPNESCCCCYWLSMVQTLSLSAETSLILANHVRQSMCPSDRSMEM